MSCHSASKLPPALFSKSSSPMQLVSSAIGRIRYVRNYDISDIKDQKLLKEWKKQKEAVALKKKEREITQEEADSYDNFMKQIGYRKEE